MKLYRTPEFPVVAYDGRLFTLKNETMDSLIAREHVKENILSLIERGDATPLEGQFLQLAPVGSQEIWAAGVTYMRSREARMEESKTAGGGDFYDRVYNAERPELFFKSLGYRAIGNDGQVRIRRDATWSVPEPELVLVISPQGKIVGYTIGNDMSSRDIEGENPLYLPQAKSYDGSCALGPCIFLTDEPLDPNTQISIEIRRGNTEVFSGHVEIHWIKRSFTELVNFLYRELRFPYGAFLMTGTGVVPPDSFTLLQGDSISITIPPIGMLVNSVA